MISKKRKIKSCKNKIKQKIVCKPDNFEDDNLSFSFKYLDVNQGQSILEWNQRNLLSKLLVRLHEISKKKSLEVFSDQNSRLIKRYNKFPTESKLKCPKNLTNVDSWVAFHLQGKVVIGGFLVGNVFYIVFLDAEHHFWISKLKHT